MEQSTFAQLTGKIFGAKSYGTRSFTYFIPSPPHRKQGYQEKEFDTVLNHVLSLGFNLVDCKLQALNSESSSGLWVICILEALNVEAFKMKIDIDYLEIAKNQEQTINISPDIIHD